MNNLEKVIKEFGGNVGGENEKIEVENSETISQAEIENNRKKPKFQKGKPAPNSNDKKFKDVLFKVLPNLHPNLRDHFLKINEVNPNSKCNISLVAILKKFLNIE